MLIDIIMRLQVCLFVHDLIYYNKFQSINKINEILRYNRFMKIKKIKREVNTKLKFTD